MQQKTLQPAESIGHRILRLAKAMPETFKQHSRQGLRGEPDRREVSRILGIAPQTLNNWCRNIGAPSRNTQEELAKFFGVSVPYIVYGDDARAPLPEDGGSKAERLQSAIKVLGVALADVPQEHRPELGDMLRSWALYGGQDRYRPMIMQIVRPDAKPDAGMPEPAPAPLMAPDAWKAASLIGDLTDPARRRQALLMLQVMAQQENDDAVGLPPIATQPIARKETPVPAPPKHVQQQTAAPKKRGA